MVIGGGAELQRALYTLACRQLLGEEPRVLARLLYLAGEPLEVRLQDVDGALVRIGDFVGEVVALLHKGNAVPGRLAYDRSNDLRLAFPASPGYERRKRIAFDRVAGGLNKFWERGMTSREDDGDRLRALTQLDSTLLVEAAAGTGKTSLLAGRVAMLLAGGAAPRSIAAITFTELAAGELRQRIAHYLDTLLSGTVPDELRLCIPSRSGDRW